jgi:peptidoglycan/LPS O-acetylase OafA/YrhL
MAGKLLDFYSIWPFFVCVAMLMLIAATPLFLAADTPPSSSPNRLLMMDGLRGFLALSVLFDHAAVYHRFLLAGEWEVESSNFYNLLGPVGVSMFFMITGYLFWSRLLKERGRSAWLSLYIGRVFRIGPLYLAAVILMIAIVFFQAGFALHESARHVIVEVVRWLALGIFRPVDVNGYLSTDKWLASATWSIRWEWFFYLSLPLLGFAARSRRLGLAFVAVSLAVCMGFRAIGIADGGRPKSILIALFLSGMLCASLQDRGWRLPLSNQMGSLAVIALLIATFQFPEPFAAGPALLLGAVFYLITSGCTVWGLLVSRPARRLGDISYGIYLLQGYALAALYRPPFLRRLALSSPIYHWGLALLSGILLIAIATVAHVAIERPGIQLGKRISSALTMRLARNESLRQVV